MKLDFKRILSVVLALIMMVSSLVMVNVVSVSAADNPSSSYNTDTGGFYLVAADFANGINLGTKATPNLSQNAKGAGLKFGASNRQYTCQAYGTFNGGSKPLTNNTEKTFDNELLSSNNDTITFTPKKKGTVNVYAYVTGDKNITISYSTKTSSPSAGGTSMTTRTVVVTSLDVDYYDSTAEKKTLPEVTIKLSSTGIAILAIEYVPDEEEAAATGWALDFTSSDISSDMQSKIGLLDNNRTQDDNWLTYSGNDYIVNPDRVHITEGKLEGTTYKYTPMMKDFIKTKAIAASSIKFSGTDNGKRYVRFDCDIHKDSVHTIYIENGTAKGVVTVNEDGTPKETEQETIYIPEDTYYVNIAGGTVEMTKPEPDSSDKSKIVIGEGTDAIEGTFTAAVAQDVNDASIGTRIDLTEGLVVNNDVTETYIYDGTVLGKYFIVNGNKNFNGDFMLVTDEHMNHDGDDSSKYSNIKALELKTMVEGSAADSSLRFHVADGASSNLSIRIMCSSSPNSDNPSKIGLRTGTSFADTPHAAVSPVTIPATYDGSADGKIYTFEVENLNPGGYYGIYNAGESNSDDDVRIYSIEFYKAASPATATPEAAKYAFKAQEETSGRLVTKAKKDHEYTGAYASFDSDDLNVQIADGKATLHDADAANSVEMVMPLTNTDADGVTSGTVKFSGTLTLKNSDGSKWSLLDFRNGEGKTVAAIRISNNAANNDYSGKQAAAPTGDRYALAIPNGISSDKQLYDYYETKWETIQKGSSNKLVANTVYNYDITFNYTEKTITLNFNGEEVKATNVTNMTAIADIKGITGTSAVDRDYEIGDITIEAISATKYPVKLSGTNNAESGRSVDLKVMKGSTVVETVTVENGAFEKQLTNSLAAGTYTLAADGCVVTPKTITVKDSGDAVAVQEFRNIKIETAYNVTVKFDFAADSADADANISITELNADGSDNGAAKTIKAKDSSASFTDVAPGTQFKITGTSRSTYQWLSRRNGKVDNDTGSFTFANKDDIKFFNGKSSKFFIYTVPSNVKELGQGEYGVQFKASSNIGTEVIEHRNMKGTNADKKFPFGQYGFGADKIKVCGNKDARNIVEEYRFELSGMDDYISHSYCATVFNGVLTEFAGEKADITTGNEFGILNKDGYGDDTFIKFTVADNVESSDGSKITAIVDRSGEAIAVYDSTAPAMALETTDINNSKGDNVAKQAFEVTAGHTYTIKTASKDNAKRTYVKSIRIYNPNNVFDNTNEDAVNQDTQKDLGTAAALQSSESELYNKIQAADADPAAHIFRVIGTIHLSDDVTDQASAESELANIEAVGFDVYKKTDYDSYENGKGDVNGNHVNANSTLGSNSIDHKTPKETIEFKDIVNASVDTDGDDTADIQPDGTFKKVYVQTFYAATESMVLVPWVQYKSSSAKVYSLIPYEKESNNIVLKVE